MGVLNMLAPDFSWQDLKSKVTYAESDSLARVRTSENALGWFLVYLNEATGEPHIRRYDRWETIAGLKGFEGFEKLKAKELYNPLTGEMVPVGAN
jgi:hypothetical protein